MGRPANTIRSIEKSISISEDLTTKVDLMLYSPLEGRVPHGAWSRYITELINKDIAERNSHAIQR